ncbi:predicted protein [Naegleria gruberi]|uniref:Predicted protein n=1 Tax=Naegleria gruberi TaxID=5762 RepID=D2VZU7_NAEGR|nr:uncharacterized protein NAEGRDRAFT_53591 [Naegleria gruberi]EFC37590.1 predicted protein [Naegleria gruberi]|eukprot:XP_002670334.1 predicted protein [Naegleria gruberi strain NEG-M]
MLKSNIKVLLIACLLAALMLAMNVKAIEEEIIVEKEGDTASTDSTTPQVGTKPKETKPAPTKQQNETPQAPPQLKRTHGRRNLHQDHSEQRALRDLMREMRNYQFGSDLFDFHHPRSNFFLNSFLPRTSLFGNSLLGDDFSDMFLNFDSSFEMMRRRMNNMWKRSFLPSLFDENHQFLENYLNSQRMNQLDQEKSQKVETPIKEEPKPIVEKKKREPISSLIKTETLEDGKLQYALDINNIPRDVFEKKDIEIKVSENSNGELVTVRAEKKTENGHFEFSKSFRFPKGSVDFEKVKASLSDAGTLSVKIPRIDPVPERIKSINVE